MELRLGGEREGDGRTWLGVGLLHCHLQTPPSLTIPNLRIPLFSSYSFSFLFFFFLLLLTSSSLSMSSDFPLLHFHFPLPFTLPFLLFFFLFYPRFWILMRMDKRAKHSSVFFYLFILLGSTCCAFYF